MNIEIEHLDTHEVRLKVQVDPETVDKAMKAAASAISRKARIPGFRKGKAPYWRIVQAFGADAVFEEALEDLGEDVYKAALDQAEIDPYGPGTLEDIKKDPLVLIYKIPLQPEVELGDYRAIRIPFEEPEVTDEMLEEAMQNLRESRVVTEPVERPVEWGDLVKLDLFGVVLEEDQETLEEDEEVDDRSILIDRDGAENPLEFVVDAERDLLPGFAAELVGLAVGDEKEFIIEVPEDYEDGEDLAGKRVFFEIECMEVNRRTLPELNDTFTADVTNGEYKTLLDLRIEMRKRLKGQLERDAEDPYVEQILDKILEDARLAYPPVMVDDAVEEEIERFDARLRQQGLTLEDFMRIRQLTREQIAEDYREPTEKGLKRALILGRMIEEEELGEVSEADVVAEFSEALDMPLDPKTLGPELLSSLRRNLLSQRAIKRLIDIAKGKDPAKGPDPEPEKKTKVSSEYVATLDDLRDEMAQDEADDDHSLFPDQRVEGGIVRID
ncbi:MAG: trigger factor [Anaerolineae bacterium]|nr:trigger factor [Anaerolineae bacterium]